MEAIEALMKEATAIENPDRPSTRWSCSEGEESGMCHLPCMFWVNSPRDISSDALLLAACLGCPDPVYSRYFGTRRGVF